MLKTQSDDNEISFSQEAIDTSKPENENLNDLKEFGVDTDEPDLFSSENQNLGSDDLTESNQKKIVKKMI